MKRRRLRARKRKAAAILAPNITNSGPEPPLVEARAASRVTCHTGGDGNPRREHGSSLVTFHGKGCFVP